MTKIAARIDWMTFSRKGAPDEGLNGEEGFAAALQIARDCVVELYGGLLPLKHVRPNPFYAFAFEVDGFNSVLHVGKDVRQQGIMAVFPGRACEALMSPERTLYRAWEHGWVATRLDAAFDVTEAGETVIQLADTYRAKHGLEGARAFNLRASRAGDTLYIGSRHSERFLRVYDKAAEQHAEGYWVRVELEMKGAVAKAWMGALTKGARAVAGEVVRILDLPETRVAQAIEDFGLGDNTHKVLPRKAIGDREKWLMGDVTSAFEKLLAEDEEAARRVFLHWIDVWNKAHPGADD